MSNAESEPETPGEPEDREEETRRQLSEMGNVIRPRMETGSYLLGLAVLLITCLLLVPLIQATWVLVLLGIVLLVIVVAGLYFILVQRPRSERRK